MGSSGWGTEVDEDGLSCGTGAGAVAFFWVGGTKKRWCRERVCVCLKERGLESNWAQEGCAIRCHQRSSL